jgi:DNA-binding beta-propeller fold protein YncE
MLARQIAANSLSLRIVLSSVLALLILVLTGCPMPDWPDVFVRVIGPNGKEYCVVYSYSYQNVDQITVWNTFQDGERSTQVQDTNLQVDIETLAQQVLDGQAPGVYSGAHGRRGGARGRRALAPPATISVYLLDVDKFYQFDPSTNQVSRTLSLINGLPGSPVRFKATSDGRLAVVTNNVNPENPNTANEPSYVLIVDLASFTITQNIPMPAGIDVTSVAITPDNLFAYVVGEPALTGNCELIVIDLTTLRISTTIQLPDDQYLTDIAMTPDGTEAYLSSCCATEFSIPVIDIPTNTIATRVSMTYSSAKTGLISYLGPTYIAMHPDGTRVYLAPLDGSPVMIVDTASRQVTNAIQIPQGAAPPFGTDPHFSPTGRLLYVLNAPNAISIIDTFTDTLASTLPLPQSLVGQPPGGVRVAFFFVPQA